MHFVDSLCLNDAIWRQRSGSKLAQVMAFLTMTVLWHSPESNFTRGVHQLKPQNVFGDYTFEFTIPFPIDRWVDRWSILLILRSSHTPQIITVLQLTLSLVEISDDILIFRNYTNNSLSQQSPTGIIIYAWTISALYTVTDQAKHSEVISIDTAAQTTTQPCQEAVTRCLLPLHTRRYDVSFPCQFSFPIKADG